MKSKVLITTVLGLLLIAGSALAERRITISPSGGPDESAPREQQRSKARGTRSPMGYIEPVHVHGVMRASRGRGVTVAGQQVVLGANCGVYPVDDLRKDRDPKNWNGQEVTIFGFRTRDAIDARLVILHGALQGAGQASRDVDAKMIPSTSDPSVGVERHGVPH